jgi:hypothetical protein
MLSFRNYNRIFQQYPTMESVFWKIIMCWLKKNLIRTNHPSVGHAHFDLISLISNKAPAVFLIFSLFACKHSAKYVQKLHRKCIWKLVDPYDDSRIFGFRCLPLYSIWLLLLPFLNCLSALRGETVCGL